MICGLYVDDDAQLHLCVREQDGSRREYVEGSFRPFLWATGAPLADGMEVVELEGDGPLNKLLFFDSVKIWKEAVRDRSLDSEQVRPLESQYLMQERKRLFEGMTFGDLRRCQVKIEVDSEGDTPDPMNKPDRVLAIGILPPDGELILLQPEDDSDAAERAMLKRFGETIRELDPDVIEGHGLFSFDLDYLARRSRRYRLKPAWGRFGQDASYRKSRLRVAERWIDYTRVDVPGRAVFDTLLAIQVFDITARELPGYELDDVAIYLGVDGAGEGDDASATSADPAEALCSLLKLSRGIAELLLPTYYAQAQAFPIPLQDVTLRGSAGKVDSLLLERYFHARRALPDYPEVSTYEGAFTKSFETGVFQHVLHYDVASLYPSLLMHIGRNPVSDELGIFIPLLQELRQYRLKYKTLAREATDDALKLEYTARQQAFKILINSFYGYLGFPQGRFADPQLAAEVTRRGRELLQSLIEGFQEEDCTVLEADTDGIYLSSSKWWDQPEALLEKVKHRMPEGIDLEYDGRYPSMFCYKAKNYALYDGEKVQVKGSAFRNRGIEPYLKHLTDHLVKFLLGAEENPPEKVMEDLRKEITEGRIDLRQLAKSEYLSMSPGAYKRKIEGGGKPRRASLEVALRLNPLPRMGERVSYYIAPKAKGQTSDWQRARALSEFDAQDCPYCPTYYLKKLDDWQKRYAEFLKPEGGEQEEMF